MYHFYGVNVDTPLSLANNTPVWNNCVLGQLHKKTNGQCYLNEVAIHNSNATMCWRVVDAVWSDEDDLMTYFRAYDIDGRMLPDATFGVSYDGAPVSLSGGFRYKPDGSNQFYIPAQNNFMTPNSGGYSVQVLDTLNPSESMSFGIYKQGNQHQNLTISFRLFPMSRGYPNDMAGVMAR